MKPGPALRQRAQRILRRLSPVKRQTLPCAINPRRIYVLPSGVGLFFAALVLAMTLGGLNYGNNPALLLALLLAGAGLASALSAHLQLSGLSINALHAPPVAAGQTLQVRVQLSANDGRARHGLRLQFDDADAVTAAVQDDVLLASCPLPTQRRGWLTVPPLGLGTTQPLGLVLAWTRVHPHARLLVHPCAETNGPPLPPPQSPSGNRPDAEGEDDLLRDYRPGDSRSRVAWKASAHRQSLLVRQPSSGQQAPLLLHWQAITGLGHEARISRLTHWVELAARSQRSWSLQLPGQPLLGPGSDHNHLQACLRALALMPDGH